MSQRVLAVLSTASSVVLVCLILALAAGTGCGRSGLDDNFNLPDGGPMPMADGDVADTGPGACNSATCTTGCCDANDRCMSGAATNACGAMGHACVDCQADGFQFCDGNTRVCASNAGACNPQNCSTGCCLGNACFSGTGSNACGFGGQACQPCASNGLACANRQCTKPTCGPDNCAGCCLGGQCLVGTAQTACGQAGDQCSNCAANGGKCASRGAFAGGSCIASSCNASNCSGCCDVNGQCQSGFSQSSCGAKGQSCFDCSRVNGSCIGQQCSPPPPPICGPWNCAGCCDSAGVCQAGVFDNQCGSRGAKCFSCEQAGQKCLNQQCSKLPPLCNASTCNFGCCDAQGLCQSGLGDATCGDSGNFCQNCTLFGNLCTAGQCVAPPPPCSQTCAGCCDASGTCQGGFVDKQCGEQGTSCADCTALKPPSTCDVNVSPRTCASQQMSCPSPYAGCPASLQQSPTLQQKGACTSAELQSGAAACATGAHSTGCDSFFVFEQNQNAACNTCLQQFAFDFGEESGILACIAPVVDVACNHDSACLTDCTSSACAGCIDSATTAMCQTAVRTGTCRSFYGNSCLSTALAGPGAVCDPAKYTTFGAWLQAVGAKYCL